MKFFSYVNKAIVLQMRKHGIFLLRISLGFIFLWFGILKICNHSPVSPMIEKTCSFFPFPQFLIFLGVWETLIGIGLIFKIFLRTTLVLLWLHILGIFGSVFLAPSIFFNGNPLLLTLEGEFVLKNLLIISASLVIGGNSISNKFIK